MTDIERLIAEKLFEFRRVSGQPKAGLWYNTVVKQWQAGWSVVRWFGDTELEALDAAIEAINNARTDNVY